MKVIPAIDLIDNKCVRLSKGDYNEMTVYSDDPVGMAQKLEAEGADIIHIVDLSGAKEGYPVHFDTIRNIIHNVNIPIEVGGGIRNMASIEKLIEIGVGRIILGTIIVSNRALVKQILDLYADNVIFGIDARENNIAIKGWTEDTSAEVIETIKSYEDYGLTEVIYTDIDRDGVFTGPNIEMLNNIVTETNVNVVASGGIATLEHIEQLQTVSGLYGLIIGKAIYEKKITLAEIVKAVKNEE